LLKNGVSNLPWEKFACIVRNESGGWKNKNKSIEKWGWSLRAIQRAYKEISVEADMTNC